VHYQEEQQETTSLPSSDAFLDKVLVGRYKILELVGKGGMSSVYKAHHLLLNKTFAVKIMHAKHIADANAVLRFKQEAAAASKLSHPNIITVHDFDIADDRPFQAIDYLEGISLLDEINRLNGLPLNRSFHIWLQICAALGHAHSNGIIHRDLKPSNVMLTNKDGDPDFVKIVDFGIAKILPQEGQAIHQLTQTGEVFGSPYYMSPEQCLGRRLDSRSDIYSMGCLMYETLTGKPPFVGEVVFQTIQKHLDEMPPSLKDVVRDQQLAQRLDFIICKTMAKDPNQRYQTMEELAKDIEPIAQGAKANWLVRASQGLSMTLIHSGQWLKNKPVRLIGALLVLSGSLAIFCAAPPVLKFSSAKIPPFKTAAWPAFSPELDAPAADLLSQNPEIEAAMPKFESVIGELAGSDDKQIALRDRAMAVAKARHHMYEQTLNPARDLKRRIELLRREGVKSLDPPETLDHTKLMEDYASIGDACYFAPPTPENIATGLFFYKLADEQMNDAAERTHRRLCMKMAQLSLRAGQPLDAETQLEKASGSQIGYPQHFFETQYHPAKGIKDRAIYYSLIGDACTALGRPQAEDAYRVALNEWSALNDYPLAAQCRYLIGQSQLKHADGPYALRNAQDNFVQVLHYYSTVTPPDYVQLSSTHAALAELDAKQGSWWQWLLDTFQARTEAMNCSG
jgi:serine/threonine protein kinase